MPEVIMRYELDGEDMVNLKRKEELIRCKDCKHNHNCEIQYAAQAGDLFYCSLAERKTE